MEKEIEYQPIKRELNIILAEDDSADRLLFEEALQELPVKAYTLNILKKVRIAIL